MTWFCISVTAVETYLWMAQCCDVCVCVCTRLCADGRGAGDIKCRERACERPCELVQIFVHMHDVILFVRFFLSKIMLAFSNSKRPSLQVADVEQALDHRMYACVRGIDNAKLALSQFKASNSHRRALFCNEIVSRLEAQVKDLEEVRMHLFTHAYPYAHAHMYANALEVHARAREMHTCTKVQYIEIL